MCSGAGGSAYAAYGCRQLTQTKLVEEEEEEDAMTKEKRQSLGRVLVGLGLAIVGGIFYGAHPIFFVAYVGVLCIGFGINWSFS
jgi:hypothetical protein